MSARSRARPWWRQELPFYQFLPRDMAVCWARVLEAASHHRYTLSVVEPTEHTEPRILGHLFLPEHLRQGTHDPHSR